MHILSIFYSDFLYLNQFIEDIKNDFHIFILKTSQDD